jgi:hypothetical protein
MISECSHDGDLATDHPVLGICPMFSLFVENITSFHCKVSNLFALKPKLSLLFINFGPYIIEFCYNIIQFYNLFFIISKFFIFNI